MIQITKIQRRSRADIHSDTGSLSTTLLFGRRTTDLYSTMIGDTSKERGSEPRLLAEREATGTDLVAAIAKDKSDPQHSDADKESAAGGDSTVGNDTETVSARIPYNNGFGDFFFLPFSGDCDRVVEENMPEEERNELLGITGSAGNPVPELDGFQR